MNDLELTGLLRAVLDGTEAVPPDALDAAYAAVELGALEEELADLVFDSQDAGQLVAMRSLDVEARLLSFVNDHLTLDLELHSDGKGLVGQLTPVDDDSLELDSEHGPTTPIDVDEFGRFRAVTPTGKIRLRVVGKLVTPWITR